MSDGTVFRKVAGHTMSTTADQRYFHVFKRGQLTVIGFEGKHLASSLRATDCLHYLLQVLDDTGCQILVVDLAEVEAISSWILGVLAAVRKRGIEVHVYHPSLGIREILDATHFDELLKVRGLGTKPHQKG
jgi:anti-anti-sigma regulatory factor